MISVRSTLTRNLIGGRNGTKFGAAFWDVPSLSFSDREEDRPTTNTTVRGFTSPAYKRYVAKQKEGTKGFQPAINSQQDGIQVPSMNVAKDMGLGFSEMENEPLVVIAEMGNHKARCEVLKRHIMMVDNIPYEQTEPILKAIAEKNREGLFRSTLPYKVGIFTAVVCGFGAIPMVFDIDLALWFNHKFVTMEVPPPSDRDTMLETGAWTWNWMEPVLGTASFTLLAMQFARQNIKHLGLKPYTQQLLERRAKVLYEAFPQYDRGILHSFVETDPMVKL